jgi:glycosyltransferase involved in cell wall biosynthesis
MPSEKSQTNARDIPSVTTVIIPAFNESRTISKVIQAAWSYPVVGEVLVVDDGSSDETPGISESAGAKVIKLAKNRGKATAMDVGVENSSHEIICFLDADILGLDETVISELIEPVISGRYDMFIGILARKSAFTNKLLPYLPKLSGNRSLRKSLWMLIPGEYKKNFQIEIALNYYAKKNMLKIGSKIFPSLRQAIKEKKWGFLIGFAKRGLMVFDILIIFLKLYIIRNFLQISKRYKEAKK